MDNIDEKRWYGVLVRDNEQLDRMFEPQTPHDVLAKKRADYIIDSSRLTRVFIHKRLAYERENKKWDFNDTFPTYHYDTFLKYLSEDDRNRCNQITYGDMYARKVNACAYMDDEWGDFISVNNAMYYFAYYMTLAVIEPLKFDIPQHVINNAIRIALRTWLGCETLDFEVDPRGKLPEEVEKDIDHIVPYMMVYIAGHEFSHHILGHCSPNNFHNVVMWSNGDKFSVEKVYNASQKEEFAADLGSLTIPKYPETLYEILFESALIWFVILDLAEYASSIINPGFNMGYQTHPSAVERFNKVMMEAPKTKKYSKEPYELIVRWADRLKDFIADDINENYGDIYDEEKYGSVYLDEPNTEWRGQALRDHYDY